MIVDSFGFINLGFMHIKEICGMITKGLKCGHMKQSLHCDPSLGKLLLLHDYFWLSFHSSQPCGGDLITMI